MKKKPLMCLLFAGFLWIPMDNGQKLNLFTDHGQYLEWTGHSIRMSKNKNRPPYITIDPDGRESWCYTLSICKDDMEKSATELMEFDR